MVRDFAFRCHTIRRFWLILHRCFTCSVRCRQQGCGIDIVQPVVVQGADAEVDIDIRTLQVVGVLDLIQPVLVTVVATANGQGGWRFGITKYMSTLLIPCSAQSKSQFLSRGKNSEKVFPGDCIQS